MKWQNRIGDAVLAGVSGIALLLVLASLVILMSDVAMRGGERLTWEFITQNPRDGMTAGGILPAIIGTTALTVVMTIAVVPVGVATAIYLSEFASSASRLAQLVRIAVQNLAGVPSIVFGLFGLGFFVRFVGAHVDRLLFAGAKVYGQPCLLWASLTMAVLTLPVVIVTTEEALRAVPQHQRDAAYALGASRFYAIFTIVVPQALPGILTGTILAVSRGAGEVAPILFTGAAYYLPDLPHRLSNQFMNVGYHIFVLATQSPDVDATEPLLYSTVAVLIMLVFALNAGAMVFRARLRRRQS